MQGKVKANKSSATPSRVCEGAGQCWFVFAKPNETENISKVNWVAGCYKAKFHKGLNDGNYCALALGQLTVKAGFKKLLVSNEVDASLRFPFKGSTLRIIQSTCGTCPSYLNLSLFLFILH